LLTCAEFETRKESAWASTFSNAAFEQLLRLYVYGIIKPLCNLLAFPDTKIIMITLDGLENMLRVGKKGPGYKRAIVTQIEQHGGVQKARRFRA
jgi:hypothetical protein